MGTREKTKGIPASALKVIAIVCMMIDTLLSGLFGINVVGAVTAVLCCYLLTEGFEHTISRRGYLIRLIVFAIMSEIPFDLLNFGTFNLLYQNAAFALVFALLTVMAVDAAMKKWNSVPIALLITLLGMALSELIRADYGCIMIMITVLFYFIKGRKEKKVLFLAGGAFVYSAGLVMHDLCNRFFVTLWDSKLVGNTRLFPYTAIWYPFVVVFVIAALVILLFYNGKKGYQSPKIVYYMIYPLHMFLMPFVLFLLALILQASGRL